MEGFEPARLGELYAAASGFGCRRREVGVRSARGRASVSVLFGISAALACSWFTGKLEEDREGSRVRTSSLTEQVPNTLS